MKTEVIWEDPPQRESGIRRLKFVALREEMKRHPNRWAKIATYPTQHSAAVSAHIKRTRAKCWRGFEIVTRGRDCYTRYVGG